MNRVCGSLGETHSREPRKNAGRPLDESNQVAPLSVERSAPPMLSPDSLFQPATIFWSVPSSTISRSVTLSVVPAVLSKTLVQLPPASVLRQMVASKPATPKSEPPSRIRLELLRLKRMVLRSDSYKGPWSGPSGVQLPLSSRRYNPSWATVEGPAEMAYSVPLGAKRTALYRVGGADSSFQLAPPSVEDNTPPSFAPWNATASSSGLSGLASIEKRSSSEIPSEDWTKVSPPFVERNTASELVPRNSSCEFPGRKRTERPASAWLPPMPICQVAPP